MIRSRAAVLLAVLVVSAGALAQGKKDKGGGGDQFEGLDLTEEPKKDEGGDAAPPDVATPTPKAKKPTVEAPKEQLLSEREITQDDRVKSVQPKLYRKEGRFELAPFISTSVNDPYYTKFGGAVRVAYYLADTLALSLRGNLYQVVPTDDVRTAKSAFHARIFYSVPIWSAMADLEWSPLYGKVSFMNSILHFDGYVLGGAGAINTETSALPDRGLILAADLGLGARFVAKDFLAVNVALINTSYVDQPAGTTKGATQNIMTLNAGVSIFFPLKSTWREAE